jgi:hypothetical protein
MYIAINEIDKEEKLDENYTLVTYKPRVVEGNEITAEAEIFYNPSLELVKTEEPKDFNFVRDEKCDPIIAEVLALLLKYNVKISELSHIFSQVIKSVDMSRAAAIEKLVKQRDFNMTLRRIDEILKCE